MTEHTATALSERLFEQAVVTMEAASVWLGHRLGWYEALRDNPATAEELAARAGTQVRPTREWLEQQAVAGLLVADGAGTFTLPSGYADALLDRDSPHWTEPLVRQIVTALFQLPAVADAYRAGGGVSWEDFGPEMSRAQGDVNRPALLHTLAKDWVPQIPALHERLTGGARVADVGCGHGWSAIGLARAYPGIEVDGYDVDEGGIVEAKANAEAAGVSDRVRFHHVDAGGGLVNGPYDVLLAVECVHDMAHPVDVLSGMRAAAKDDALVVVIDEAADADFSAPGDEIQRLLYGFSLFICLPDSLSSENTVATGAVMRPGTLAGYATQAGFSGAQPLDVRDTGIWRVYQLGL